jgi:hypothetical protein
LHAGFARHGGGDVEVGREVVGLGNDAQPARVELGVTLEVLGPRQPHGGVQRLVKVGRGVVGGNQFTRPGADQARDLVAGALWLRHPAGAVPAADQAATPLLLHDLHQTRRGGAWQGAE